jgi:putative ABC transport system permease protein
MTTVLFGLAPAMQAARQEPQGALKDGGAATGGRRGRLVAGALVVVQLSMALLLLAGAGVLVKTVIRSVRFDPGFDPTRVLQGELSLPERRYATASSQVVFAGGVMDELSRLPGARIAIQSFVFFRGFGGQGRTMQAEGVARVPDGASPSFYLTVTPDYFHVLGVRLVAGRDFTAADRDAAIVNEELSRRLWGDRPALGRRIRFAEGPWRTVVGVARNINGGVAARPNPLAYVPFASEPGKDITITLTADADPRPFAAAMRAAVSAIDPDQPIDNIRTMAESFREQLQPSRFVAQLMGGLSAVALALASVGLYGVTAYGVRRRQREIGIRVALGGSPRDVVRLVVRGAWTAIAPGLALGLAGAAATTRLLEGLLFGTSPTDPVVFAAMAAVLAAIASAASYLPARRAARIDPIVVLRTE